MNIKKIDSSFSTTGQIQPEDLAAIKQAGFAGIICARPDGEDADQPPFSKIEQAARAAGLNAFHIPVAGPLGEGQIIRFEEASKQIDGPILGYCRSGARAGSLHAAANR
ncbi:oxidoreductase [Devosia pacifica]|uniref:Oxidoreductase n=1 Tax=Devosia pacifica TaxID=1335967 RepID=A0A918S136_9HYPH|nr:TIGR01244 family sulfur transferase [Devosia pacifica]GHA18601.1 oxidoreductase [Devosia pacifica]